MPRADHRHHRAHLPPSLCGVASPARLIAGRIVCARRRARALRGVAGAIRISAGHRGATQHASGELRRGVAAMGSACQPTSGEGANSTMFLRVAGERAGVPQPCRQTVAHARRVSAARRVFSFTCLVRLFARVASKLFTCLVSIFTNDAARGSSAPFGAYWCRRGRASISPAVW